MVFVGSWLSGYLIVATNAWMQHPVAYALGPNHEIMLAGLWGLLLNHWAVWQYVHNMSGAVITGAFVMASVGAFYLLWGKFEEYGRIFVRVGVIAGLIFSVLQLFPTGDWAGRMVARKQPVTLAAMEALWETQPGAPLVILGQPNVPEQKLDNPIAVPRALSFLTWRHWNAEVQGLNHVPKEDWPDNIPLLYYSYHIMVGLGTMFIAISVIAAWMLWRNQLYSARWMLWILLLAVPFPYIANTGGWMTAELGRQPWLVYGLLRTVDGYSKMVSAGNGWFSFLGFLGMYAILAMLFLFLVLREIQHGPELVPEKVEPPQAVAAEVR
jgi:cytochrome d ubiquinol oxidase subunit I